MLAFVNPCLESAKAGNRDGVALSHLNGDHIQDAMKRVADLSPGETPWAAPACYLVYHLSFVHHSIVCHAFSFRERGLPRCPTGFARSAAAPQQVGYE
jgi:hypothetical protein